MTKDRGASFRLETDEPLAKICDGVEDILTAYETRIKELSEKLKEKSAELLDYSKSERVNLTQELESLLAKKDLSP